MKSLKNCITTNHLQVNLKLNIGVCLSVLLIEENKP